jgi:hypothetical protein
MRERISFVEPWAGSKKTRRVTANGGTGTCQLSRLMPQLTALADHPGEPLPIFRGAFLITGN